MNLSLFGLTLSSSWGNGHATPYRALLRALARRGARVTFFERDVPYYARHRDFEAFPYCDLVLYRDWVEARQKALLQAGESDVVLLGSYCPDGAGIADDLLGLDRPVKIFYDLDTPITLRGLECGGVDYLRRDQIPEFDLYLSFTGGAILRHLEEDLGARCARPLYGCVDPDVYFRVPTQQKFSSSLSYMGTFAPDRQQKLDDLFLEPARRRPDLQLLLAGSLYPSGWSWPANVRRFEHVAPGEHPALYSSSRATLNLTRQEMANSGYCPSGRFFEAAACGTPILTDWWKGLDDFFDLDNELVVVHTAEEVLQALKLPDEELQAKAELARTRTLDEHTGDHRAEQLLAYCEAGYRGAKPRMEAVS